jgi:hypothetical protein
VLGVVERQVGVVSVTAEVGRAILVPVSREFLTFSISKRFFLYKGVAGSASPVAGTGKW